jgi:hypothetical protein
MASLCHQLMLHRPIHYGRLVSLYESQIYGQKRPSINHYAKLLPSSVQDYNMVYFIIDALDECSEANGTRRALLVELQKLQPAVNIMITSHHIPSIERLLQNPTCLEIQASGEDITNYVQDRVSSSERIRTYVEKRPDLESVILKSVSEKAGGM